MCGAHAALLTQRLLRAKIGAGKPQQGPPGRRYLMGFGLLFLIKAARRAAPLKGAASFKDWDAALLSILHPA